MLLIFIVLAGCAPSNDNQPATGNTVKELPVQNGNGAKYVGQVQNNIPQGYGKVVLPNGDISYEGLFENGKIINGKSYQNGKLLYEGEFKNEKPDGHGKAYNQNSGVVFEGEFKDGSMYGRGKIYDQNGQLVNEYEVQNGMPVLLNQQTNEQSQTNSIVSITKSEFDTIKNGMTYEQVKKIIGGEGQKLSETGSVNDPYYTVIYMYNGEGTLGANANFTFQNNKLLNKTQFGLQ